MTLRVLWAAILSSMLMIAAMALVLPPSELMPESLHLFVFAGVALGSAVMSFVVPEQVFRSTLSKLELKEAPDPQAPSGFGEASRIKVFADPARARRVVSGAYKTALILGLALSESIGILGLVLNRLGHPFAHSALFFAASVLLVALRFPAQGGAAARARRVTSAAL